MENRVAVKKNFYFDCFSCWRSFSLVETAEMLRLVAIARAPASTRPRARGAKRVFSSFNPHFCPISRGSEKLSASLSARNN